jgi:hypothetical protein
MKKTFDIELSDNRIEDYEEILSRFSNWIEYKREINLNQILEEGKKIEFQVEIQNKQSVFYISVLDEIESNIESFVNVCSVIQKMTFVILNNKILKLNVEISLLTTKWGKIITNLLGSNVDLQLQQHKNIEGKIDSFYFQLPKQAA